MSHRAPSMFVPIAIVALGAFAYLLLALRQQAGRRGWSGWRIALFLSGSGVSIWGLSPQLLPFPEGDFRKHMLAHLLVAMLAPLGLVMAAPVTLVLRTLPSRHGRVITRFLRSPFCMSSPIQRSL